MSVPELGTRTCNGVSSSGFSAALRRHGRSPRGRSRPSGIRRIGVLWRSPRVIRRDRPSSRRSGSALEQLGWNRMAAIFGSTSAGRRLPRQRRSDRDGGRRGLHPDLIATMTHPLVSAMQQLTRTIPIVFIRVLPDPVGSGFVSCVARPGGNITGFENFEPDTGGKWLELLKDAVPEMTRVGILLQPENSSLAALRQVIEAAAPKLAVQATAIGVHDTADIQRGITAFAEQPNGGLIVLADPLTIRNRDLIIVLAARYRLPAIYMFRYFATSGGLIAYGSNQIEQWRGAAGYVDRILKGESRATCPCRRRPSTSL